MSASAAFRRGALRATALGVLVFLHLPVAVLVAFSFNAGLLFHRWEGFSLRWYARALANEGFRDAALTSLLVSVPASLAAVLLALAAAIGLERLSGRGSRLALALIGLPLVAPEISMAVGTLLLFSLLRSAGVDFGLVNLVLAHAVFALPFALMPIRACLKGVDPNLSLAARDLHASSLRATRRVLLPLLLPGAASGAALAFIVSFDDFAVSQLVAGPGQTTLPVFIWAQLRRPLTPELNALCALALVITLVLAALALLPMRRRARQFQTEGELP